MAQPRQRRCTAAAAAILLSAGILSNILWASTRTAIFGSWTSFSSSSAAAHAHKWRVTQGEALVWEQVAEAPVRRLDGAAAQIGSLLYVFAGYSSIDEVHSHVDVYDLEKNTWGKQLKMPPSMAHSHLGMASDGRYIYIVSGQHGPQCGRATAACFVLDTFTGAWSHLPPLPLPRYAPATQLWRGRLHVMGGSKEDRYEPAMDHWSLAVSDGRAVESEWRVEARLPRGGPHRASVVVRDRLYVIGGQEGDFVPKPGSPIFKCSRKKEVVYGDVYVFDDMDNNNWTSSSGGWTSLPQMPKPNSHIDFAAVVVGDFVITAGGSTKNNPVNNRMVLLGDVFLFDTKDLAWKVVGQLPYRVKTALVAHWDGWLYVTCGQRDKGSHDPSPKKIVGKTWKTRLQL